MSCDFEDFFLARRAAIEVEGSFLPFPGNPAPDDGLAVFAIASQLNFNSRF